MSPLRSQRNLNLWLDQTHGNSKRFDTGIRAASKSSYTFDSLNLNLNFLNLNEWCMELPCLSGEATAGMTEAVVWILTHSVWEATNGTRIEV